MRSFRSATVSPVVCVVVALILIAPASIAYADPPAPVITSFSPASGPVGTSVTIDGDHFSGTTAVKFNGVTAKFTVHSSNVVSATVPSGTATGKIALTTPSGTATSAKDFTVTASPVPTISSFSPTSGAVGTSVTVTGTGFTGASAVKFNGTSASFSVDSATKITAKVPTGATTGKIAVTTPGGTATSATDFTVTAGAAPTISSFSPTSGPVGTSVTILGKNLTGTTAVRFNGVTASFSVNSAGTQLSTTVPAGATSGKIAVTTPGGTATSATNFTVAGPVHARTVTLQLRRHIRASGTVIAADGYLGCEAGVPVKVQRRVPDGWRTITTVSTDSDAVYEVHVGDREGRYRAKAPKLTLASGDVCSAATSSVRTHLH